MLRSLHIRNLAVIEQLELEFERGMTVLTGETGAGKSILVDSLGLVLGDRADTVLIRPGAQQADVNAVFTYEPGDAADTWLRANDLGGGDGECHLRRTVAGEGRSKAYINGTPVPVQQLRAVGEHVIDIHGQHAHQSLLKRPVQMQLLDAYAGHAPLVHQVASACRDWRLLRDELARLQHSAAERAARLDLLRYQVHELEELNVQSDELAALEQEQRRLAHTQQLLTVCSRALSDLDENDEHPVIPHLNRLNHDINQVQQYDPRIRPVIELLDTATVQLQEAVTELRRYLDQLDTDPRRLEWVDQRLAALYAAARKHHIQPDALFRHLQDLQRELATLDVAEQRIDAAQAGSARARDAYLTLARRLSGQRLAEAQILAEQVTRTLRDLGIPEGRFEIEFETLDQDDPNESGLERCEFLIATGARMPLRPLHKVASGGELSRISLAIQAITAQKDGAPTLIFDEVDVGIGGRVAEMVGQHLRGLAKYRQIICVTHLPQVAALTNHHYQVSKSSKRGVAVTRVRLLSETERKEEIARMLGGLEITEHTRAHAADMLNRGRERA